MHMTRNIHGEITHEKGDENQFGSMGQGSGCQCFIIPAKLFKRLARSKKFKLTEKSRKSFTDAAEFEAEWRNVRHAKANLARLALASLPQGLVSAGPPAVTVFNCKNGTSVPGTAVANPGTSTDKPTQQAFTQAQAVANFYKTVFGRNSVDGRGMGVVSSVHYSVKYNNAFWNGSQMVYGDGDGSIFLDFTGSDDVIAHELTHGVTQYTAGLAYENQPGGLNESISDVFGSMFRQWQNKQDVTQADWLIGKDIMGPAATKQGYTCLRDLSNPAAAHCLSPQPTNFSKYKNGMDPHESSGIPNFAFCKAATAIGGNSWTTAGKVWYQALTAYPASPNLTMSAFAKRTRTEAGKLDATVKNAVDQAWKAVGL
jgi:Zn-dependent metalloprotease